MELLNALTDGFVPSFSRYLQNTYCVPGTASGAGDEIKESDMISVFMELTREVESNSRVLYM